MGKQKQIRKLAWLALALVAGFAGLGYRLVDLQVFRHEKLKEEAEKNTEREFIVEPRRGDILDCRGNLLATSQFVKRVCANPSLIGNHASAVAAVVSPALEVPESELLQKFNRRTRRLANGETGTVQYVVLKEKVSAELWASLKASLATNNFGLDEPKLSKAERLELRNLRAGGIFADPVDDQLRTYPNQALAAHVLGYVGREEVEFNGVKHVETHGKAGVEQTFDSKLSGIRGWRRTETDRHQREMIVWREQNVEARDGLNVVLTIDSVIQHLLEEGLAQGMQDHSPLSISGIVLRPRTGEILAMANLPTYDPNRLGASREDARRNRVISDLMEPGSTFKVVVVSGALNEGIVKLTDAFDCEHGAFFFGGKTLHDHEHYGVLSVEKIITKSSNIGAAKIGIRLGAGRLYDYMVNYGFGSSTGILLPGEVSGRNYVPAVRNWSKVSIAQIPMGHGVAVTRLQMAMAMCAIANRGVLMRPMLVNRLEDQEGHVLGRYSPQAVRQVTSEAAAKLMVQALKTVTGPDGTAPKAALEHYTVAGKTGTAQKTEGRGYSTTRYFASFIGFFPADNPEVCISIVLDEPREGGHYGGQTAAPIFKRVAEQVANYLNITPDIPETDRPELAPGAGPDRGFKTAAAQAARD